jgi:cytochrome c peroxidase
MKKGWHCRPFFSATRAALRQKVQCVRQVPHRLPAVGLERRVARGDPRQRIRPKRRGGRGWDGRANSAHDQAEAPLLSPFEMANADRAAVVARLRASPSARQFREVFGPHTLPVARGRRAFLRTLTDGYKAP